MENRNGYGSYTPDEVRAEVKRMIAEVMELSPDELSDTSHFQNVLGMDSLLALEIMVSVDKKFHINIPEEEYQTITIVNDTVAMVLRYLPAPALQAATV